MTTKFLGSFFAEMVGSHPDRPFRTPGLLLRPATSHQLLPLSHSLSILPEVRWDCASRLSSGRTLGGDRSNSPSAPPKL